MKYLFYILVLLGFGFVQAQTTNTGLPIGITTGTTVTVTGGDFTSEGNVLNDGTLIAGQTISIPGTYSGAGEIRAVGGVQNIDLQGDAVAVFTASNGDKTLLSPLIIEDLTLNSTRLITEGNDLEVSGTIAGADDAAYVIGKLIRSGNDALDFPVGTSTTYAPISLTDISGVSAVISVQPVDADPNAAAGKGLLDVSANRYWDVQQVSGTFESASVTLQVINETVGASIQELVVSKGNSTGTLFTGLGQSSNTGDLASGTVTAATAGGPGIYALGKFFDENLRIADSLALVSIYQAAAGNEWNNSNGWLSDEMDTWNGVTIQDKRVNAIDISSNNLMQTFPEITEGLEDMTSLDLSDNELTGMGSINNFTSLTSLDVSNNHLQFGDLETLVASLPSTTYAPQKRVLDSIRTLEEVGTVYTMDRTVTGSANAYSWTQNGNALSSQTAGSFDIDIQDFSVDGIYVAEVTNSNVPGLTLETRPVVFRVSSLERDRESLRQVYLKLNADEKGVSDWFASDDPVDWEEVEVVNNRVTAVDLSSFELEGEIPDDILDVEGLTAVDFSDNLIEGIPVLGEFLPQLGNGDFDVSENKLDFEDIEPVFGDNRYNYSPQKPIIGDTYRQIDQGSDTVITVSVGGSQNIYDWKLNDVFISGENSSSLSITNLSRENMGDYELQVTSDLVDDLTLSSGVQTILAQADISLAPIYQDIDGLDAALEAGDATGELYEITDQGRYRALDTVEIVENNIVFENKILDDYIVYVRPADTLLLKIKDGRNDSIEVLPTYYERTIDWVEATPIELDASFSDSIFMEQQPRELTAVDGDGTVNMLVESDFPDDPGDGSRIDARRRVKKAGCSLRRRVTGGGRTDQDDEFELIAYKETDENGNVSFGFLPSGEYRLNIQYPGVPMDPDSFTEFVIEPGTEGAELNLEATVTEEGITVQLIEALGFYRKYFKNLDVYPNPADQFLTIRYEKLMSDHVKVKLLNMNGKTVREAQVQKGFRQSMKLDVSDVDGGIYLLYFYDPKVSGKNISIFKVIVRH